MKAQPQQRTKLTPPQLAAEWGIEPEKIIGWIRAGELRAVNVASRADGKRARWLIDRDDIAAFEAARSSKPAPRPDPVRRQRALGPI
jgi:Helix-turn-helix domain